MRKQRLFISFTISLAIIALAIAGTNVAAEICGSVDQMCDEPFDPEFWGDTLDAAPIGQSFTPTEPYLNCVDVQLTNSSKNGATVYLMIREGSITGPVRNTRQTLPSVYIPAGMPPQWVKFQLCYPIKVTPGRKYVIQLFASNEATTGVGWMARCPDCPDYLGGEAIRNGDVVWWDYKFKTYYKPQAELAVVVFSDFWLSSDQAGLNRINTTTTGTRFYAQFEYTIVGTVPKDSIFWVRTLATILFWATDHRHKCATDVVGKPLRDTIEFPDGWPYGPLKTAVVYGEVWLESDRGLHNMSIATEPISILP